MYVPQTVSLSQRTSIGCELDWYSLPWLAQDVVDAAASRSRPAQEIFDLDTTVSPSLDSPHLSPTQPRALTLLRVQDDEGGEVTQVVGVQNEDATRVAYTGDGTRQEPITFDTSVSLDESRLVLLSTPVHPD